MSTSSKATAKSFRPSLLSNLTGLALPGGVGRLLEMTGVGVERAGREEGREDGREVLRVKTGLFVRVVPPSSELPREAVKDERELVRVTPAAKAEELEVRVLVRELVNARVPAAMSLFTGVQLFVDVMGAL